MKPKQNENQLFDIMKERSSVRNCSWRRGLTGRPSGLSWQRPKSA